MMLFQRIRCIVQHFCKTNQVLAESLGVQPTTFQGYLNEKRQDNLWPLLPRLLELYPQINRDWLYFDEGSMLRVKEAFFAAPQVENVTALRARLMELEEELKEERRLSRRLTECLLGLDMNVVEKTERGA